MIIIQSTFGNEDEAKNIIESLVAENHIACETYHAINSIYKWQNEVQYDNEIEVSIYTDQSNQQGVIEYIQSNHSYELPKITVIEPTFTTKEYEEWLKTTVD